MATEASATPKKVFEIEPIGETIVVIPQMDLHELDYQRIEAEAKEILDLLLSPSVKNIVLDFHKTDFYGSTALSFFVKLLKRVRSRNGHMAFCNVSDHEKEILKITKLDQSWPLCSSRSEALATVAK
jgi:anti-anti-sigma factor